ncbi:acetate kinase [Neisseria wadsworthii]|uniref:Acetate kinase n=1 Tax=Neisseria wadsworthii 9715 TaxID=1030841 RepID=G4CSA6_9NEIS|nr:acetate kinase [Neisseria wadsworthii]EGZ44824.1 acetate kinase [Neisseria wadsworthii 9715]QMT35608.1 acetate kinase [Neisseria wadsworthii]
MTNDLILVLNCGSSSLKGALIDNKTGGLILSCLAEKLTTPEAYITFKYFDNADIRPVSRRSWFVDRKDGDKHEVSLSDRHDHTGAVEALLEELRAHDLQDMVRAIGHRVVHGGEKYSGSVVIDDKVMAVLEECIPLAPLHNPANLTGIRAAQSIFPGLINVGVFDTAFHQTMPEHAYTYAVPQELYQKYGFRRYGFHGTSFRYVAPVAAEIIGKDINDCSLVIAHLGNGASVCAVKNGESQDTSMGVTPLEGLVMGTRSGDLDPSTCSFLADNAGMDVKAVTDMLNKKSGLLGISGLSNDCRTIQEAAAEGHAGAKLALEVMTYRLAKYIAAMAVATNGIDALVFTGGIGENSDVVRSKTVNYLGFLGLTIDEEANKATRFGASGIISQKGREPAVVVVPTNEERMIAMDTGRLAGL